MWPYAGSHFFPLATAAIASVNLNRDFIVQCRFVACVVRALLKSPASRTRTADGRGTMGPHADRRLLHRAPRKKSCASTAADSRTPPRSRAPTTTSRCSSNPRMPTGNVEPAIIAPLRAEWDDVKAAAFTLDRQGKRKEAIAEVQKVHRRLCERRVLDRSPTTPFLGNTRADHSPFWRSLSSPATTACRGSLKIKEPLSAPHFVLVPSLGRFVPCHFCALCSQRVSFGIWVLGRRGNLFTFFGCRLFCHIQILKKTRSLLSVTRAGGGLGGLRCRIVMRAGGESEDDGGEEQFGDGFHFANHRWTNAGVNPDCMESVAVQSVDTTSTGHFACNKTLVVTLPTTRL